MDLEKYQHVGDPAEVREPTARERKRQKELTGMREYWDKHFKENPPPPLSQEQVSSLRRIFNTKTPDHELMRWDVRLFCGHRIETTAHYSHRSAASALNCVECGAESTVIAARPPGLLPEVKPQQARPASQRASSRAALAARLAKLEAQAQIVREQLAAQEERGGMTPSET